MVAALGGRRPFIPRIGWRSQRSWPEIILESEEKSRWVICKRPRWVFTHFGCQLAWAGSSEGEFMVNSFFGYVIMFLAEVINVIWLKLSPRFSRAGLWTRPVPPKLPKEVEDQCCVQIHLVILCPKRMFSFCKEKVDTFGVLFSTFYHFGTH